MFHLHPHFHFAHYEVMISTPTDLQLLNCKLVLMERFNHFPLSISARTVHSRLSSRFRLSPPSFTPPQPRCLHISDSRSASVLNQLKGSALTCPLYSITCNSIQKHSLGTTFTWAVHSQNCGPIQPRVIVLHEWKDGVFQSMCHRIKNNSFVLAERAPLLLTWTMIV